MNLLQRFGRLGFVSARQRKKIIWKTCELLKIPDRDYEIDFYGFTYRGNTRNHIDRYVYYLGAYEKGILSVIAEILKSSPDSVFIDIGANTGHHTLFSSKYAAKVYAFEPYAKVRDLLKERISKNNLKNVEVVPFALGKINEELTFYEPSDANTGTGSLLADFKDTNKDLGLKINVRNGAELFQELGITRATLMKIDVEGFEATVLSGLLDFMKKTSPRIIMEYSRDSQKLFLDHPEVQAFLKDNYVMKKFKNPNSEKIILNDWDFNSYGDILFTPKGS